MKKLLISLSLLASFACIYRADAQINKFISVKGKEIIDINGRNFLIKGTNLGNWLVPEGYMFGFKNVSSPRLINEAFSELMGPDELRTFWKTFQDSYVTAADIHFLKVSGMNSIRIPFNYRLFTNEGYLGQRDPNRGFELLDRVIGWCKTEGIFVILDMHCAPGGQTGDNIDDGYGYPFLFRNKESQEQAAEIWKRIAAHYKDNATVMGYDLLNEPIATYFKPEEFNPFLEPVYKLITKAIRTVDVNHILFLGGAQWDSNFKIFGAPFDSKLVYTFHKYWTPATQDVIQDYINFRDKNNVPIYCGETGENDDTWVKDFRVLLEKNNIGWHYWPYKKLNNTRGITTFAVPVNYDKVVSYTEAPRSSFEEIRKAAPQDREEVKKALYDFLNNSKFENCHPNKGYIEALGLKD